MTRPVFTVRAATADDIPRLIELATAHARDEGTTPLPADEKAWRTGLTKFAVTVAVADSTIVGMIVTGSTGAKISEILSLFVAATHRRQGIGSALLQHAVAKAAGRPIWVDAHDSAVEFYRRMGFDVAPLKVLVRRG